MELYSFLYRAISAVLSEVLKSVQVGRGAYKMLSFYTGGIISFTVFVE